MTHLGPKTIRFAQEIETALQVEAFGAADLSGMPYPDLLRRLRQRLIALEGACFGRELPPAITHEAAQVAALALIIADKAQPLAPPEVEGDDPRD